MKILTLDIETAPNLGYVWGLWKQNIGLNQIHKDGYVLSWAAKYSHTKDVYHADVNGKGKQEMLEQIHTHLDQADAVVHYNGTKFDIPWLNGEFAKIHLAPPAPYHQIDLLKTVRSQFRFPSYKLQYVAKALGIGNKTEGMVFEDWIGCMEGDQKAWAKMVKYNAEDVKLTERLYKRLLPWIKNHPNHGLYKIQKEVCPTCGGGHYQCRGDMTTRLGVYKRFQCQDCGTWFRGNVNEHKPAKKYIRVGYS